VHTSLQRPPLLPTKHPPLDEPEVAAAAFLARYSGRTLEGHRYDVRTYLQWPSDLALET
jgi:hypothetical protein